MGHGVSAPPRIKVLFASIEQSGNRQCASKHRDGLAIEVPSPRQAGYSQRRSRGGYGQFMDDISQAPEADAAAGIGGGVFVAVAGPSGVGKDTIINYARDKLAGQPQFVFVRRIITRTADIQSEDHDTLPEAEFASALKAGKFSLVWQAHGLNYALPRSVDADIAAGKIVIANISRQTIDELKARYEQFLLVVVSAHRDVIAARLKARGRETDAEIVARLNRIAVEDTVRYEAIRLENSGPKERAGDRFVSILEAAVLDVQC
jgi:ribose 1,5-bisphosphokinase